MHTTVCDTLMGMAVDRLSITVDAELGRAVREAARASGTSLSSWAAEALADAVRHRNMQEFLDDWEAEQGPFTEEELAAADELLAEAAALGRAAAAAKASERLAG